MEPLMNFVTIRQYFYKVYNSVMLFLLAAIFSFIAAYLLSAGVELPAPHTLTVRLQFCGAFITVWLVIFFFLIKKIKSVRNQQGLRLKLEKYFQLTIVRYSLIMVISLMLAFAFYATNDDVLTVLFAVNLVLAFWFWPTSAKVCKELKLRGDEREMVYFKKDTF
jgi:hypothetical protein